MPKPTRSNRPGRSGAKDNRSLIQRLWDDYVKGKPSIKRTEEAERRAAKGS